MSYTLMTSKPFSHQYLSFPVFPFSLSDRLSWLSPWWRAFSISVPCFLELPQPPLRTSRVPAFVPVPSGRKSPCRSPASGSLPSPPDFVGWRQHCVSGPMASGLLRLCELCFLLLENLDRPSRSSRLACLVFQRCAPSSGVCRRQTALCFRHVSDKCKEVSGASVFLSLFFAACPISALWLTSQVAIASCLFFLCAPNSPPLIPAAHLNVLSMWVVPLASPCAPS